MEGRKSTPLTGVDNSRLNNVDLKNNQLTSPLADEGKKRARAGMTIPAEEDVVHAKEWVDDGSLL